MMKVHAVRAGLVLAVLGAASVVAVASVAYQNANYALPGVDLNGSPSLTQTGAGTGKIYKESTTGILVAVFAGVVPNKSGAAATFTNQGLPLTDPWTQNSVTATADYEMVGAPNYNLAQASLGIVYVPARGR